MPYINPQDYLEAERTAPFKSEYYSGQMWAMSGSSCAHDAIAFNLVALMRGLLRGTPCRGFTSDMRMAVADVLYTYPDLSIARGEPQFIDAHVDTLANPTVLVEILSPSTANYDRTGKFMRYCRLPSLREYVLVHQDAVRVERFEKYDDIWAAHEYSGAAAVLELGSVGVDVPLAGIYEDVDLDK